MAKREGKKRMTIIVPEDVDELCVQFARSTRVAPPARRIKRCIAITAAGTRCRHTINTARIGSEGTCTCSHPNWVRDGRRCAPVAELWVDPFTLEP